MNEETLDPTVLEQSPDPPVRALARCAALYQEQIQEENMLDFCTIQREAFRLPM